MTVLRRSVLFRVATIAATVAVAVGASGFRFVSRHRHVAAISADSAEAAFSRLRAHFGGQRPIVDMDHRGAMEQPAESGSVAPIRSFHTVIYDTRGGSRLVRIDVPYWFARRFAGRSSEFTWLGELTFLDDTEFDSDSIRLGLRELERRGSGLVAYRRHSGGGQFISWVE